MVERFNRTLKNKMWKYFTRVANREWVNVLPDFMHNYNTAKHKSLGMTPQGFFLEDI